jgi:hypothetical protein
MTGIQITNIVYQGTVEALKEAIAQQLDSANNEIQQIDPSDMKDVMIHVKNAISNLDNAGELLGVIASETKGHD